MKDRPILFSGPMVRAILEGQKTQTRRAMKEQPRVNGVAPRELAVNSGIWSLPVGYNNATHLVSYKDICCPYGQPGDRLWVKETFYTFDGPGSFSRFKTGRVWYRADGLKTFKWKPSIFMPRHASRITLEITAVRVERLHDISEEDAVAEGVDSTMLFKWRPDDWQNRTPSVARYAGLWESINGPGSWEKNPWVWVIKFRRINQ